MFKDDMRHVLPISSRRSSRSIFSVEPNSNLISSAIKKFLPTNEYYNDHDLSDQIHKSIEDIAGWMLDDGSAALELVSYEEGSEDNQLTFSLELIYGESVSINKRRVIQKIPKTALEYAGPQEIEIPIEKCCIINFPPTLGGKTKYSKFLKTMNETSKSSPFMNFIDGPLSKVPGYDVSEHFRLNSILIRKATKDYSWTHRGNDEKIFSNFHYIYRYLKFKKTKILLRDHIISELNKFLILVSPSLGFRTQIVATGLPTIQDVDTKIGRWMSGKLDGINIVDDY